MRCAVAAWCVVVMTAALYTGVEAGCRFFTSMTGLLPPHYGYSAYTISALLFLAPWPWLRWVAAAALLASGNRASWVGAAAGWASAGGRRRLALASILAVLGVVGGQALKPRTDNDSIRVHIWKAALRQAAREPHGIWGRDFLIGVDGGVVDKMHSDALQLLVVCGWAVTLAAGLLLAVLFYVAPAGPWKSTAAALTVQSLIDNRLHHPACAALYAVVWISALRARPLPAARDLP